ncbi:mechanosensitive ion channel family protein [Enterococcus alcedinis]|uniref:Mechanosensitive ion channel protein MscS n=1 Tax=Enterococcus alcedinis TaxID=1274384 RepID=A0A917JEZ4_9ENTE|nr:mechanosensitive ion channel domain-containing protein [Enterococcus alcedinis]MBP2100830.1 small conductance mechanosensitive channel [Enterococcus alcedinis]GGI64872.1 mechanosensitive ion channel protein MscS [Enterococcus alcedinis]
MLNQLTTSTSGDSPIVEPTIQQLNALQRWWNSINWESILSLIIQKSIAIGLLILLFILLARIANFSIKQMFRNYQRSKASEVRLTTLKTLVLNVTHYTLSFFFIYALLSILGVPVGSLLAGAGVAGLAIGLGAQGFTNDLLTGFFIIFEQQIDVGDYVILSNINIEGTVTQVGLRLLQIRSIDGTVHFIPNRNITTVSNQSREARRVIVDVRIDPSEGIEGIREAIDNANQSIAKMYAEDLQTQPTIFGTVDLGNSNYAIRTTLYVENGKQATVQQELLTLSIFELTKAGYSIPNTPIVLK